MYFNHFNHLNVFFYCEDMRKNVFRIMYKCTNLSKIPLDKAKEGKKRDIHKTVALSRKELTSVDN